MKPDEPERLLNAAKARLAELAEDFYWDGRWCESISDWDGWSEFAKLCESMEKLRDDALHAAFALKGPGKRISLRKIGKDVP